MGTKEQQPSKLYSEIDDELRGDVDYDLKSKLCKSLEELFINMMADCMESVTNKYHPCFDGENIWWEQSGSTSEKQYSTKELVQEFLNTLP